MYESFAQTSQCTLSNRDPASDLPLKNPDIRKKKEHAWDIMPYKVVMNIVSSLVGWEEPVNGS